MEILFTEHYTFQSVNMKKLLFFPLIYLLGLTQALYGQEHTPFYSINHIEEVKISFEQENWKYLLDSLRFNGDDLLVANVEINGNRYEDVGVGYRDSRSFSPGARRNGLILKLNFINQSQNHEGYKTLLMSSALRDPSMVREVLFYEIARKYMPAPKANYAKVDINDEYYGLFVNLEAVDKVFVDSHFGSSNGSFFKCAPNVEQRAPSECNSNVYGSLRVDRSARCYFNNFTMLSESGWDDLINLTETLQDKPDDLEKVLDVDRTLWMLALNNAMVNLESYIGQHSQNYYLYRDASGRFNPVIWEVNLSFGSYKNIGSGADLSLEELQNLDPLVHLDDRDKPLINVLLNNSLYQKMYLSHIRTIVYDNFYKGEYEIRAKEIQDIIKEAFVEDPNKTYTLNDFNQSLSTTIGRRSKIPGIAELMTVRNSYLRKSPEMAIVPPLVSDVKVLGREQFSNENISEFKIQATVEKYPKTVTLRYRFGSTGEFKEARMLDNGKSNDGKANDQIFGVTVKPSGASKKIEYYIFVENAKAVTFDPPNYMYNLHTATLGGLNE